MAQYGLFGKRDCSGVPLEKIQVRGTVVGFTAEITATMEYNNNGDSPIEAIYVFPLDEEAAVCGFQATIDGRTIVAEVQDKQQARDTYDDAISSGHSAYLLEESDESSDVFQINVGNLPPKKSATVEITFVTGLTVEKEGRVVFVLPTVLNPRYTPSDSQHSLSSTIPTIASVSSKYSFDFELDVQCASSIQDITSPCNRLKVDINPEDNRQAKVRLDEEYKFDADVQVHVLSFNPFEPHALVENGVTKTKDGKELNDFLSKPVVMLNFFPEFDSSASLERGEFVFVVDRSGSMNESKIKSARETLILFLKSLPDGCYFNVIGFGSSFQKLFTKSEVYSDSTVDKACSHAESMQADLGGTEILSPLQDVFSQRLIKGNPRQVFLLTDGEVGNTREVIDLVSRNAGKARCFTFGIGSGASTALIKGVARAGRGKAEFVISTDKMQGKVVRMLKNALQPALLDCTVSWDLPKGCSAESVPNPLPPIFSGDSLLLYGLLTSTSNNETQSENEQFHGTVTLSATIATGSNNETIQHKVSFEGLSLRSEGNKSLLHRLAAKALIQTMQQDDADNDNVKEDIIRLSKSANVISKLTSFVAVDEDSHEPVAGPMRQIDRFEFGGRLSALSLPFRRSTSKKKSLGSGFNPFSLPFSNQAPSLSGSRYKKKPSLGIFNSFSKFKGRKKDSSSKPVEKSKLQCRMNCAAPPRSNMCAGTTIMAIESEEDDLARSGQDELVAEKSLPKPPSPRPTNSSLLLVSLQQACGSWQLSEQLASICGVTLDKLKNSCPSELTADNKESVWATALALSCLFGKFKDKRDEWEMIAAKGTKWLKKNTNNDTLGYDKIMEKAANIF